MTKIITIAEMRAIEAAADKAGISYGQMMDSAGQAVAERVKQLIKAPVHKQVLVLVGPGNNGGDGLVAGRLVAQEADAKVTFILSAPRDESQDNNYKKAKANGLTIILSPDDTTSGYTKLTQLVTTTDVIIDALLGTGTSLPLRGEVLQILKNVQAALAARRTANHAKRPVIVAVDIPSGMDADTGELDPLALHADQTVTFEGARPGHFSYPGAAAVGTLHVASLNLPLDLPESAAIKRAIVNTTTVAKLLPARPPDANKGTFGKALIVAGSAQYIGAAALAAHSAYRVGAGLVAIATPEPNVAILAAHILEAVWLPLPHEKGAIDESAADVIWQKLPEYTAALIGPGIGQAQATLASLEVLFAEPEPLETHKDAKKSGLAPEVKLPPLVIDADGLNLLAKIENWWTRLPPRTILTPHAGEMARLCGIVPDGKRSAAAVVQSKRIPLAVEKAKQWNCIVVLKGAYTFIADPDGRGALIPFADAALARAGTGDVLAGAIAGYLAQGLDPFDAAVVAAYLHGLAGKLASERLGTPASVLAGDVIACLSTAIHGIETSTYRG